ncbi:MAG TPA: hypothetical protein VMX17_06830 [Candidatus Glassbacteria bacterium]|nr:hypothetical protein [Candidatus Glassbacteria bacterium]
MNAKINILIKKISELLPFCPDEVVKKELEKNLETIKLLSGVVGPDEEFSKEVKAAMETIDKLYKQVNIS